jgi:hypothetical protein
MMKTHNAEFSTKISGKTRHSACLGFYFSSLLMPMGMSLAGRAVNHGAVTQSVLAKEAQRVRRNVDRLFERCRKASSVAEFMACIDDAPNPVRDVARTIVLGILNSMGFNYSTWEEAKRDARNIPYYYLASQFARS